MYIFAIFLLAQCGHACNTWVSFDRLHLTDLQATYTVPYSR